MAQLGEAFDHESVEKGADFELMPPHECMAQIVESDVGLTKAGTGKILKITVELMDGQYSGRKVWDNINFQNPNAQAQLIAQQRLKDYCEATGHTGHLTDSEDLHFKPFKVKVGVSKLQQGYEQRNEIKGVKPLNAAAPPAGKPAARPAAPGSTRAAPPPKAAAGARPWGNRASA